MRAHIRSVGLALTLLSVLASAALAQGTTPLRVDGHRIKSYIAHLSTDEMMGRQSMTAGYQTAAQWVADQFEAWGLEPAGDNGTYFQKVPIGRGLTWNIGVPELAINGTPFSVVEGDFTQLPNSTVATKVNGEVVFVGYGISAPAKGLDEYAGTDVRGKVVLALRGSPADAPRIGGSGSMAPAPRAGPEPQEAWTEESRDLAKVRTAYEKGASAILLYNPDAAAPAAGGSGAPRGGPQETFTPARSFLAFTITDRAFRTIMKPDLQESVRGFTTRLNGLRNEVKYGKPQSMATGATAQLKGYDAREEYSETLGNNWANNVIAKLPGADRRLREEFVVMGGHLDHLGVRDGQVYNGADDNASGTAVVMEVARALKEGGHRPARTVVFAAWCGEEMGLIGSNYFVANPPPGIDIGKVVTYFNMDMVGLGDAIGAPGALNFPTIWDVIRRGQDPVVIAAVQPRTGGPGGSDHSAFISRGIEALALMTAGGVGHPYYHRPEDDTEKIDPEILRKTGQFVLQGTVNLANERQVNLLIPDRQNLYNALQFAVRSFTPGRGQYAQVELGARNHAEMTRAALDSALAVNRRLQEPQAPAAALAGAAAAGARGALAASSRKTFERGIRSVAPFEGDLSLLVAASELIGFGRLDVEGDDGAWFAGGRVTDAGGQAIHTLEENGIWLHLASPSPSLLSDMLAAAAKPFIVSGRYALTPAMVGPINEKGVILAVGVNPADVPAAIAQLSDMKLRLGDTNNLVLSWTNDTGVDEARQALYLGLLKAGWTHEEIAGARGTSGGIGGGNLGVFGGAGGRPAGR